MIINNFLPEKIRSYYLFTRRIVAINITNQVIQAVICKASGNKRIIEKCIEQPIEQLNHLSESNQNINISKEEKIINSLKFLKPELGKYNKIICSYNSSGVVFKEISLPFLEYEKLKAIIPFEIEPLLPFTLDSGVIDFIITKKYKDPKQSDLLVVAIKKNNLENFVSLYDQAGLIIDKIVIDSLELYGLYKLTPEYNNFLGTTILINLNSSFTEIIIIENQQLKYIRSIAKIATIDSSNQDLFNVIDFTITNYKNKAKSQNININAVLMGPGTNIPDITSLLTEVINIDVILFDIKQILDLKFISSKVPNLSNNFITPIATAIQTETTQNFNLELTQENKKQVSLIKTQLITAIILTILPLLSISIYSFLHINNLKFYINKEELSGIDSLKGYFKLKPVDTRNLELANKAALKELRNQETTTHSLSEENRYALLKYLLGITKCLNLKEAGLDISQLEISLNIKNSQESELKLYGSVPSYEHLNKLQVQLQCSMFKPIGKLHELNFKINPIDLFTQE